MSSPSLCPVLHHRSNHAVSPVLHQPQTTNHTGKNVACGASAHDNSDFHSGSLQEEQWRNPSEQENITSLRGALGESQQGRGALGSTRGGSGIHPPAKTPRGRDNPSSKTLDSPMKWPLAPFPCLGLEATPEDAAQLGHWCFSEALTQHELACCAARQLRPSWPGGAFPPFQCCLGIHSSLPKPPQGVTTTPAGNSSSHPSSTQRV